MTEGTEAVEDLLPRLRGLRLGRCARRILLLAPPANQEPRVIPPARAGRAAAESHTRAMRSLAANALVELTWKTEIVESRRVRLGGRVIWDPEAGIYRELEPQWSPITHGVARRAVTLTPLGEIVVDRLRPTLENGRRIRWGSIMKSDRQ